jgi:hypothetical protein
MNLIPWTTMLGTTRQGDDFENIEVNEKSTAPTKVLSTYGGVDTGTNNYFFHVRWTDFFTYVEFDYFHS